MDHATIITATAFKIHILWRIRGRIWPTIIMLQIRAEVNSGWSEIQPGKFVGDYQLAPNFILSVTAEKGRLYVQATGQVKLPVFVKGQNEFFYKAVNASLSFIEDEAGNISSLILHQNGNHPARKIR